MDNKQAVAQQVAYIASDLSKLRAWARAIGQAELAHFIGVAIEVAQDAGPQVQGNGFPAPVAYSGHG